MGMTSLNVVDRDLKSQTIGLIAFDTPKSIITRFLVTGMVAAFNGQAASSYFFAPPQTQIDTLFKKHRPAPIGNRYMDLNYNYENDLHNFQLQNPLTNDKGSLRKIDEMIGSLAAKPSLLFFMFTQTQQDDVWRELKFLHTKYSSPLVVAMYSNLFSRAPANPLPACIDYAMQINETPNLGCKATPFRSKAVNPTSMPAGQHPIYVPEEFTVDPATDLYISSTPKSTQMTLAEVDAELYDLRGFDAQRAAPDKVKTLLKRRQELTGNNKRPSFMS